MCRIGDHAERFGAQRPRFGQQLQCLLLDVEQAAGDLQKMLPRLREAYLLLVPVEEDDVVFLLQLAHLVGNRRLGQATGLGGAREAARDGAVVKGSSLDFTQDRKSAVEGKRE